MAITTLSASELHERLVQGEDLFLLDVREPQEYRYANIAGSTLIPLRQIPARIGELDPERHIVVICHHGMRSMQAATYLAHQGFQNIANLTGGIDAWSLQCDSAVLRY
ncbi:MULTISPECIES: rhodanese-like domain-containing protein [Methylomicrobium]|uniref:Rhodanese-related sulfurtransferase n=1 Tax=Methylomicrobium album BG8 TaxID=686340 RepID=H8GHA3_METAL|nr:MULTISPECIES: rhodanese-like domain-containing protein [Methylomicrobium]EIC28894.1 Rhodanese-related sulfurtransferase [Methylomicrobium album BG8]